MTNRNTPRSSFVPSIRTDDLRPAVFLAATQVMIAFLASLLLANGILS